MAGTAGVLVLDDTGAAGAAGVAVVGGAGVEGAAAAGFGAALGCETCKKRMHKFVESAGIVFAPSVSCRR